MKEVSELLVPTAASLGRSAASPPPRLVVTDVDSTLIAEEVIEELAARAGTRERVARITARAMNGEIDFADSLRERVATLADVPQSVFAQVLDEVHPTEGAQELIDAVHAHGGAFGVVSGGFEEVVAPLARRMRIDHFLANRLEISAGRLTGRILGEIVTAEAKVRALEDWARLHDADLALTVAIGDGANDIAMMRTAGIGIAFCAKPAVREAVRHALDLRRLDVLIGPLGLD